MGKDDLIKIKQEIYEQGVAPNPIDDLDIYYDSDKGVYKHKFVCDCGEDVGCFCFELIETAINDVETGMVCSDCYNREMLEEYILEYPDNAKLVDEIAGTKIHTNMIHKGGLEVCMDDGKKYDEIILFIKTTIEKLTTPELNKIVVEIGISGDGGDFSGHGCEI